MERPDLYSLAKLNVRPQTTVFDRTFVVGKDTKRDKESGAEVTHGCRLSCVGKPRL